MVSSMTKPLYGLLYLVAFSPSTLVREIYKVLEKDSPASGALTETDSRRLSTFRNRVVSLGNRNCNDQHYAGPSGEGCRSLETGLPLAENRNRTDTPFAGLQSVSFRGGFIEQVSRSS